MANSVWVGPFGISNNGTQIVFAQPGAFPDGSIAAPAVTFSSQLGLGLFRQAASVLGLTDGSTFFGAMIASTGFCVTANRAFTFSSSNGDPTLVDTQILRQSAGVINVTTGYAAGGTAGVATFGPAAVASITVKGGIVTAIS